MRSLHDVPPADYNQGEKEAEHGDTALSEEHVLETGVHGTRLVILVLKAENHISSVHSLDSMEQNRIFIFLLQFICVII